MNLILSRENYHKIAFLPLDIEADIPSRSIIDFVHRNHIKAEQGFPDPGESSWHIFNAREPKEILSDDRYGVIKDDPSRAWRWNPDFKKKFPGFISLCDKLPFKRISWVPLACQIREIHLHKDSDEHQNVQSLFSDRKHLEPAGYRCLIYEDDFGRNNSLYVSPYFNKKKAQYIKMPKDYNFFLLSDHHYWHGATPHPRNRKVVAVIFGEIDEEKHLRLIERSLQKFGDYAIVFDDVYVPWWRGSWAKENEKHQIKNYPDRILDEKD
jgi:hypothetical protein